MGENTGPILAVTEPKFMKFLHHVGDPSWFPTPLPDCWRYVPRRKYWPWKLPLSCEVVKNRSEVFGPQIFAGWKTKTNILRQFVTVVYAPPCGKVWLSFVVWSVCAKPGNEEKRRIFGVWAKTPVHL